MFAAISAAITSLFTVITTLCSASNKTAKALDNLATVAEEMSGTYVDNARADRELGQEIINRQRADRATKLAASTPLAISK